MSIEKILLPNGNEFIIKGDSLTAQLLDAELDVFEVSFNYDMCVEINTKNLNYLTLTLDNFEMLQELVIEAELYFNQKFKDI